METQLTYLVVVLACLAFSFMFSGMEAGVFALSRLRILQQQRAGRYAAQVLQGFLDHPENFLWTILIGNTLSMFVVFSMAVITLHRVFASQWGLFVFAFVLVALWFYALCDLLPKMLFRQFPNRLCLILAMPFRFVHLALSPLVAVVEWLSSGLLRVGGQRGLISHIFGTRGELRWVMQESAQSLTSEERTMINRVLDLQTFSVGSVTVPLSKAVTVHTQTPLSEVMRLCREKRLTRLPVWSEESGVRRIAGIISLGAFLYEAEPNPLTVAAAYTKPALRLHEDMRVELALRRMQRSGQRLAIVLGRDQREAGIVSLQDLLKVIFGDVNL